PFLGDSEAAALADGVLRIEGQVLDGDGEPVAEALLEAWDGDQFARCRTDPEGTFHFLVRRPPAGTFAGGRSEAPHLELTVFARGLLRQLATRIYFPDEAAANDADPVLGLVEPDRRDTLIARAEGEVLRFDVRLQGARETVFFAL
ncbi:MAG: protocatechuate 3,4-dioxygenase subunit alpha, partial [Candidatus Dormibacteraeota bacterium]|nr:protocatechuate 3,4-dioxygenase subunit alpha [Candidatus Dormibacteraeota bacterium]